MVRAAALANRADLSCRVCAWSSAVLGLQVGTELFPQIDSGEFVLRFRPPPGSNFELTRQMALKCLEEIEREAKPENIDDHDGLRGPGRHRTSASTTWCSSCAGPTTASCGSR